jgi:hypothetical protein
MNKELRKLRFKMWLLGCVMTIASRLCPKHLFKETWANGCIDQYCMYCGYNKVTLYHGSK